MEFTESNFSRGVIKNPVTINDTIALGINYRPIPGYVILPVIASSTTGGNSWNFSTDTILGFVPVCALGSGALHVVMQYRYSITFTGNLILEKYGFRVFVDKKNVPFLSRRCWFIHCNSSGRRK